MTLPEIPETQLDREVLSKHYYKSASTQILITYSMLKDWIYADCGLKVPDAVLNDISDWERCDARGNIEQIKVIHFEL